MADKPRVIWDFSAMATALGVDVDHLLKRLSLNERPRLREVEQLVRDYHRTEDVHQLLVLLRLGAYFIKREK